MVLIPAGITQCPQGPSLLQDVPPDLGMCPHVCMRHSPALTQQLLLWPLSCAVTILPWTSCPLLPAPPCWILSNGFTNQSNDLCIPYITNGQTYLRFLAALLRLLCGLPTGDGFAPSVGHNRLVTEILLSSHWHLDSSHGGSSRLLSLWASLVSPHDNFTRPLLTCFRYPVWSQH